MWAGTHVCSSRICPRSPYGTGANSPLTCTLCRPFRHVSVVLLQDVMHLADLFAGLEVLLPPPSLPLGMVFCCITHLTLCARMLMPSMLSPGAQSLLHTAALRLFSISLVSPVPQGESPVASWGCCCSQMLDWLSPWQGRIRAHGSGCNKSCWGLAGVSD